MKKSIILATAALLLGSALTAQAADVKGGIGFHLGETPLSGILTFVNPLTPNASKAAATVGGRQWVSETVGIDAALGFNSFKAEQGTQKETWTGMSFDIGLPIVVKRFDKVNLIVRPGVQFGSLEDKDATVTPTKTTKYTMSGFSGTLEAEWYVTPNLSLSAAHGLAWASMKDNGSPSVKFTSLGTTGSNFTQMGFNLYIW